MVGGQEGGRSMGGGPPDFQPRAGASSAGSGPPRGPWT